MDKEEIILRLAGLMTMLEDEAKPGDVVKAIKTLIVEVKESMEKPTVNTIVDSIQDMRDEVPLDKVVKQLCEKCGLMLRDCICNK